MLLCVIVCTKTDTDRHPALFTQEHGCVTPPDETLSSSSVEASKPCHADMHQMIPPHQVGVSALKCPEVSPPHEAGISALKCPEVPPRMRPSPFSSSPL